MLSLVKRTCMVCTLKNQSKNTCRNTLYIDGIRSTYWDFNVDEITSYALF